MHFVECSKRVRYSWYNSSWPEGMEGRDVRESESRYAKHAVAYLFPELDLMVDLMA